MKLITNASSILSTFVVLDIATPSSEAEAIQDAIVNRRAIGSACRAPGATSNGVCENIDTFLCHGYFVTGACANNPTNVKCCTEQQSCIASGVSGFCADVNHVGCSVAYITGHCPGGNSVQCCRGESTSVTLGMTPGSMQGGGSNKDGLIGGIVGGICVILLILFGVLFLRRGRRRRLREDQNRMLDEEDQGPKPTSTTSNSNIQPYILPPQNGSTGTNTSPATSLPPSVDPPSSPSPSPACPPTQSPPNSTGRLERKSRTMRNVQSVPIQQSSPQNQHQNQIAQQGEGTAEGQREIPPPPYSG